MRVCCLSYESAEIESIGKRGGVYLEYRICCRKGRIVIIRGSTSRLSRGTYAMERFE